MPFPRTLDELLNAGYVFKDRAVCRGCGENIEWWCSKRGKYIPMNPMQRGTDVAMTHWATCEDADLFRGGEK